MYIYVLFAGAQMMESAIMDVAPDEAMEMNKKKRMLRWDAKKRKFVKVRPLLCLPMAACLHAYICGVCVRMYIIAS
jgi:hypothetical protein